MTQQDHNINESTAIEARGWLVQAADAALLSYHATSPVARDQYLRRLKRCFLQAGVELGFGLHPVTREIAPLGQNDSGRLSSAPENETAQFEPHQAGGA